MSAGKDSTGFMADRNRLLIVGLIALTALGLYLRLRCLGCLGFRWDEDLTALTVKALSATGVPELPSGMIYIRFYPIQWIIASSVNAFGFSEFSLRLPSVLFGTALIPTGYWVASRLFDKQTGIIVAAAIALSFNQVEMARTARMYAPFFLIYLLAAYTIFAAYYRDTTKIFSPLVLMLAAVALSIHQLAYSLAVLLILAIPLNPSIRRSLSLIGQAGLIGVLFLATKSVQEHFFYRAERLVDAAPAFATGNNDGLLGAILSQLSLPDISLSLKLFQYWPIASVALLVVAAAGSWWAVRPLLKRDKLGCLIAAAALASAVAQQFTLAVTLLAILAVVGRQGIAHIRNPLWYKPAIATGIVMTLWAIFVALIAVTATTETAIINEGPRQLIRSLVDYPNFRLFWSFVLEYPLLAPALFLGTLWAINGVARKNPDPVALFVGCGFWAVLFANSVLKTQYEFLRYNLHIEWFFIVLCVVGLTNLPSILKDLGWSRSAEPKTNHRKNPLTAITAVLVIASVNPAAALLSSSRDYYEDGAAYRWLDLDSYPDFSTPAAFVRDNMQSDDAILVFDPREYWNYIGRVDYWMWSKNYEAQTFVVDGEARDLYLGIPVLNDLASIRRTIAGNRGSTWIPYSREWLERTPWIDPDIKQFIRGLGQNPAYTGRDRDTVVIRIDATSSP